MAMCIFKQVKQKYGCGYEETIGPCLTAELAAGRRWRDDHASLRAFVLRCPNLIVQTVGHHPHMCLSHHSQWAQQVRHSWSQAWESLSLHARHDWGKLGHLQLRKQNPECDFDARLEEFMAATNLSYPPEKGDAYRDLPQWANMTIFEVAMEIGAADVSRTLSRS
ncbi:uncharacterized protein P884DRAFT_270235 [Thermothelomyces heterothallicus CBS 202.75]|uniref:uncharacterized protein n=1 Tax=Thermothelomyces heterothallicus CBS 202.75 TaxID=1149848 RepID=UPI003741E97C